MPSATTDTLTSKAGADVRFRSFSVAGPLTESQRQAAMKQVTSQRRPSRALDVKPSFRSDTPLWKWIHDHVDKQMIGLSINFLILIVLLMLLKVFVQWIQLAQQAVRGSASGGDAAGGRSWFIDHIQIDYYNHNRSHWYFRLISCDWSSVIRFEFLNLAASEKRCSIDFTVDIVEGYCYCRFNCAKIYCT